MSELQIGPDRPVIKKLGKDENEKFFICACNSIEHQAFFGMMRMISNYILTYICKITKVFLNVCCVA